MKKLIIIRGNSGSGKSTIAKRIRETVGKNKKIALVEQYYLRRFILKEKECESGDNIELIQQIVLFALKKECDIILEGILYSKRYKRMLQELVDASAESYVDYLDIPFEETLRRHKTKHNSHEFGEKEMGDWYKEKDVLNFLNEKILNEDLSEEQIIKKIIEEAKFQV